MNRSHNRLVSAAVLAVSMLAPLSAQAQGSAPNAAEVSASAPLTPGLLAKMLTLVSTKGRDGKIAPRFANAMGLTAAGQGWTDRQASAADGVTNHFIAVGPGADSEILLTALTPKVAASFRVRRDGTLLSALSVDAATRAITMRDPYDAAADFAAECAFWAQNIDNVLAQK